MIPAHDLLDHEFSAAVAANARQNAEAAIRAKSVAIRRKTSRITIRRAKSEALLHDILPLPIAMDEIIRVLSSGDIDALSYLIHISRQTAIEHLLVSTWCMAMPDIAWLKQAQQQGRIGFISFVIGEIFPSQYPDEYLAMQSWQNAETISLKICRNHAKVIAGLSPDETFSFVIESSANINTNPRIEQTAILASRTLYNHYTDFFSGIRSIDRATRRPRTKT